MKHNKIEIEPDLQAQFPCTLDPKLSFKKYFDRCNFHFTRKTKIWDMNNKMNLKTYQKLSYYESTQQQWIWLKEIAGNTCRRGCRCRYFIKSHRRISVIKGASWGQLGVLLLPEAVSSISTFQTDRRWNVTWPEEYFISRRGLYNKQNIVGKYTYLLVREREWEGNWESTLKHFFDSSGSNGDLCLFFWSS